MKLTNENLRVDLNIKSFGKRKKILDAIEGLVNHNVLDLVVLHSAPLVVKKKDPKDNRKCMLVPIPNLNLEAEGLAIVRSLKTDIPKRNIKIRFEIATTDNLRSLMTAWKCKVRRTMRLEECILLLLDF